MFTRPAPSDFPTTRVDGCTFCFSTQAARPLRYLEARARAVDIARRRAAPGRTLHGAGGCVASRGLVARRGAACCLCGLARCGKWPVAVRFGGAQPVSGSVGTFALGSVNRRGRGLAGLLGEGRVRGCRSRCVMLTITRLRRKMARRRLRKKRNPGLIMPQHAAHP